MKIHRYNDLCNTEKIIDTHTYITQKKISERSNDFSLKIAV